jgi:DNA-binding CsgD family transcriptional regulator
MSDAVDLAELAIDHYLTHATRRGDALPRAIASHYRAVTNLQRCRPQQAAADAEISRQAFSLGWQLTAPAAAGHLALAHVELDDLDAAEAALVLPEPDRAWERTSPYTFWLFARGQVSFAQGRHEDALASLVECGRRQEAMGSINPNVIPWRSAMAMVLARTGDADRARALVDEELVLAERFAAPRAIAVALRAAAVLQPDERIKLLTRAVEVAATSPSTIELVRAQIDLGAALRREGDRNGARAHLRAALDHAERGGAVALARRAREELAASGAKPRRAALTGPGALTPSERRVADLAAAGRRNREIADELFVSVKAVEFHLGNAYRKLGVSSREHLQGVLL